MYQPSQVGTDLPASKSNLQVTTTGKGDGLRRGDGLGDILQRFQSILENLVSRIEKQAPGNAAGIAEINSKLTKLIKLNEKLENSSRSHTERLETVETYVAVLEEVREKIDLMEDRTNEVDEKIFSFENRLDDRFVTIESRLQKSREKRKLRERGFDEDGSIRVPKRRKGGRGNEHEALPEKTSQLDIRPAVTASFNTNTSASSSLCTDTSADRDSRKITSSLLERLESRLIRMEQNAGPSPQSPWEIEVVMLPPAPLKGIWNDGTEFGGYESSNPQSVSTFSGACSRRKSNDFSDGPVPRSFSVNSRLYRRLGTRGFVKHINVLGPTAQDVAAAVDSSFGKVINWCHSFYTPDESVSPRLPSQYQRVSLGWQPLRKVHKQTNLEFLKPGEMMEIMWTVDFLKGSCIMKGRRAVLYITSLLPTRPSSVSSISWNDIKTLPEYIAVSELDKDTKPPTSLQPDLEDAEDPWAWKETLDDTSEEQAASPSVRSVRSAASWSSFGPFQLEDEARAQHAVDDEEEKEEEEPKLKTPSPANLVDSGLNDCDSLGPPSPPVSFSNKKGKNSSPRQESGSRAREEKTTRRLLRRQKKWKQSQDSLMEEVAAGIEGLTPTLTRTTRSSIRQSSSITTSGKSSSARDSWLSSLSFSAVQANPRTLGWVNDNTIPEDLEEEEENVSGDALSENIKFVSPGSFFKQTPSLITTLSTSVCTHTHHWLLLRYSDTSAHVNKLLKQPFAFICYNPDDPPIMPARRTAHVLQSLAPNQQKKATRTTAAAAAAQNPTPACSCGTELAELRQEVSELTRALNEMKEVMYARLLFPHMSLAEAQTDATEVTWEHVRPPKRQRSDSALYLPDIPDGFSDSTAHSLVFKQRTRNAEKECERASVVVKETHEQAMRVTRRMAVVIEPPTRSRVEKSKRGRSSTLRVGRGRK
ncbi:uncharacterized protein LAJ45_03811 [Morchella importuna]|uniref:uncharacterized protein n=1 Tax=Morchella importuna TaxID=1174673 RepID=UPI001E8CFBC8|nr:uncharacterized protein LAJ45_03811 [Morchella importuna]KAH8151820.1 hypothetical protein LAJ45_03811 [Morchella importuna]